VWAIVGRPLKNISIDDCMSVPFDRDIYIPSGVRKCREFRCKWAVKFLLRRNGERENFGGERLSNGRKVDGSVRDFRIELLKGEIPGAFKKA
jgi:hypothetical protein